jgi:hypothetical protein
MPLLARDTSIAHSKRSSNRQTALLHLKMITTAVIALG